MHSLPPEKRTTDLRPRPWQHRRPLGLTRDPATPQPPTQAPQIFISYRRDDAAGYARAVCDELARHFGAERVFMDVDDIGAGQAFDDAIRQAVGASRVLLVVMGKRWQGERAGAAPRINDAGDFVRLEVAAALAAGLRVIPLLIDGATIPTEAQLPDELRALARRNALGIDYSRFAADIERLVAAVRDALGEPAPMPASTAALLPSSPGSTTAPPGTPRRAVAVSMAVAMAVSIFAAVIVALIMLWQPRSARPSPRRCERRGPGRKQFRLAERPLPGAFQLQWRGGRAARQRFVPRRGARRP